MVSRPNSSGEMVTLSRHTIQVWRPDAWSEFISQCFYRLPVQSTSIGVKTYDGVYSAGWGAVDPEYPDPPVGHTVQGTPLKSYDDVVKNDTWRDRPPLL